MEPEIPPLEKSTNVQAFIDEWIRFQSSKPGRFILRWLIRRIELEQAALENARDFQTVRAIQGNLTAYRSVKRLVGQKDVREELKKVIEHYGR